ncbi:hypothetical protein JHD50_13395 [Sulfurimonas sp. MAG313]|nr:phospholipase D-like domain-containing protein [Sulfurimonas sp. MAG313]MDF1882283.1 hypothetical protein [Sulfurimonas sp. MAG313]
MLKLFIFFPFFALASNVYTLPQENHYFVYSFTKSLKEAQKEVNIFTHTLNEYSIVHAIKQLSKRGLIINIFTKDMYQKDSQISYLSLLKGVHIFTLKHKNIKGSFTCIDDKEMYLSSQDLSYKNLRQDHAFVIHEQRSCIKIFINLKKNALKII